VDDLDLLMRHADLALQGHRPDKDWGTIPDEMDDDREWVRWYQKQQEGQIYGEADSFHLECCDLEVSLTRAELETLLAELQRADTDNFIMHHEDLTDGTVNSERPV
jgi:hypothetical protein